METLVTYAVKLLCQELNLKPTFTFVISLRLLVSYVTGYVLNGCVCTGLFQFGHCVETA